ncbi:TraR/DksA family transcriptional regulator [Herbidospora sp. RD11066]
MESAAARMRLEMMLDDVDRSIGVLTTDPSAEITLTDADRNQAMIEAANRHRRAVVAALSRLDAGTYGRCVDCHVAVPEGRLEARPEAARCIGCQSRRERRR